MAETPRLGLLDLEKELTCSVCTEILYQPLTLLDCLHTFCGSCLKEWFSWQASQASNQNPNPFTCPSCRASVRDTKPNAGITTLLDMYLQANPGRVRNEEEKADLDKKYSIGESVLPKIRRKKETRDEAEDRRMVEEAREMSLRDVGIRNPVSYERGVRHRIEDGVGGRRSGNARRNPRFESSESTGGEESRPSTASDVASNSRQIEHQSSLRSLLSASDVDSSGMEEEILRQIMDEGILDGIDLNNIDVSQEDELSERIADAYRRRHEQRSKSRNHRSEVSSAENARSQVSGRERHDFRPSRSPNPGERNSHSSHPPVSRPHLLEAYPTSQGHRRRTSSETRRQTSPIPPSASRGTSSETQRQAARSSTDLSSRTERSSKPRVRPGDLSDSGRRITDPENIRQRGSSQGNVPRTPRSPTRMPRNTAVNDSSPSLDIAVASPQQRNPSHTSSVAQTPVSINMPIVHQDGDARSVSNNGNALNQLQSFEEPSVTCDRCKRIGLEYELHWNCPICHKGNYNLCSNCYRAGRGCLHWFGFGYAALKSYRKLEPAAGYAPDHPLPHQLESHRFLQPSRASTLSRTTGSKLRITSNPSERLQSGPFCSNCSKYAPSCFWKCDVCNEGEWGFCNSCVNQGKCCIHALLPVALKDATENFSSISPTTAQHFSTRLRPSPVLSNPLDQARAEKYIPLNFSTKCDICTYPIPSSTTRFHCLQCNAGDYDIDTTCYNKMVRNGRISAEHGPNGWRRCPNGHRMIVIGFEDSSLGQERIVIEDLVGGYALKDDFDSTAMKTSAKIETPPLLQRYPPNGGVGMYVEARWSWWPKDGAEDELAFPKGAEIRECIDVNGDFLSGVYCSRMGVFPANHGRILETISMD